MKPKRIAQPQAIKWILCGAIALFILLGINQPLFSILGFLLCLGAIAFCSQEDSLVILIFTMSFANIFKTAPGAQSLFTYALLFFVFYHLLKKSNIHGNFFVSVLVFVVFLLCQMFLSMNLLRTIKFVANILFLYVATQIGRNNERDCFRGYVWGVVCSSTIGWLNIPAKLELYIHYKSLYTEEVVMDRFSGLYADPNYYSVNLIIALALLVLLYHRKEIKLIPFAGLVVALLSFVVLTYSKSSFLMLLLPIYMFLYANFRGKRYYTLVLSLILFAFAFFYLLDGKLDMFSTVLARFDNSDQLSKLTSGRSRLWQNYMTHFSKSFPLLLFGNGFDAELLGKMAPHNTYIDLLYYLGILGTVLLFVTLSFLNKPNRTPQKKTFLNYSVLLVVLIMYFFLSQLFYFDMPFHILLALMVLNADLTDHAATRE